MTTIDNLLLKIVNFTSPAIEERLHNRDSKVLRSLATSITSCFFITENQSRLLMKILKENSEKLPDFSQEISEALSAPMWSHAFRQIEQVKKIYISNNDDGDLMLTIDFSFNSQIRKIMSDIAKKCENLVVTNAGKKYYADLTEHNIVTLVEALKPHEFDIEEKVENYYNTIKSWSEPEIRGQFLITNMTNQNFHKVITADLGISTSIDQNIINDRSMRYQYFTENVKNHGETLTEVIANRSKTRLWIDKKQHSVGNIISSLIDLKRLPMLVVFDTLVNNKYLENLKILSDALEENGIFDNIGIYFRLPNDDLGKQFNGLIADKHYNHQLDENLKVACVMSGKIPKFFLKNAWRPMSVLALDSRMGMRHGKTAVYSNCCDLIVEWAEEPSAMDIKAILR